MRKPFKFQQFAVSDQNSAMKVNTDAVLLGSWCDADNSKMVLDIGTGCGIIALMIAQRSNARVDAIEIDPKSIKEARENFLASAWGDRLNAIPQSLQQYAPMASNRYDLIVCNPPFFQNSLTSPKEDKTIAKHDILLTLEELIAGVSSMLADSGIFSLVLPPVQTKKFVKLANLSGFYVKRQLMIRPKHSKPVNRVLTEFVRNRSANPELGEISLRNEDNTFSAEHDNLTEGFYLAGERYS
jgi:tRNA1Val (adenine37-N6)-methyltransferase